MARRTNLASDYSLTVDPRRSAQGFGQPREGAACDRRLPVRGLGRNPLWSASAGQVGSTGPKPNTHPGQRSKAILVSVAATMRVDLIQVLVRGYSRGSLCAQNGRPLQVSSSTSYSESCQVVTVSGMTSCFDQNGNCRPIILQFLQR